MANALKTLFTDIAESIRGGLPDEGLMKPNVFPSKIDEIVALLENAGSGEGGTGSSGSVGNLKFASGSYNVGTNRNRATVTHGFNTMPDLIIVWYTGFYGGTKEEYVEEFPLELAWGMKSKFSSQTLSGYVIPGFGVSANSGINNYTDSIGIYCPDQYTFQFGSSANDGGGRLLTGARYNWLAISGMGGVDSGLVKYVTFIGADGSTLWRMPVLDGDDCKDPITHGDISTPTKESTAQYNYTYSGWSLTEGGSADANALKAVTEDRTVYAAFTESVRKYTVRFYDGDTLLATKQVEYGGSATYTATKENYLLSGWNPEPSNVTEDMDCYAVWVESQAFSVASWEYIRQMSESGNASKVFAVGDTRTEQLGNETVTYTIVDFNKDTIYGSEEKAGITILSNVLATNQKMFSSKPSSEEITKWENSDVYSYLNNTIKPLLPSALQLGLKNVTKQQRRGRLTATALADTIYTTGETIWIPSQYEVNHVASYANAYSYFTTTGSAASRIGYKQNGTASEYWLRFGANSTSYYHNWYYMNTQGQETYAYATNSKGVRFGFCI